MSVAGSPEVAELVPFSMSFYDLLRSDFKIRIRASDATLQKFSELQQAVVNRIFGGHAVASKLIRSYRNNELIDFFQADMPLNY